MKEKIFIKKGIEGLISKSGDVNTYYNRLKQILNRIKKNKLKI